MTPPDNYKMFAIISEARTGSTVLSHKLGLLEGVGCHGEIFHPDKIHSGLEGHPDISVRQQDPVGFLHTMMNLAYEQKGQSPLMGFKLFFDHNQVIKNFLIDQKIPIILLERDNKLAQYSSLKIARKTGKWHSKQKLSKAQEEENERKGKKVSFSMLEFLAFSIRSRFRFQGAINLLNKQHAPYLHVTYESMFNDNNWLKILGFLKIQSETTKTSSNLEKQNSEPLLERFSNPKYTEFCCKLLNVIPWVSTTVKVDPDSLFISQGSGA